MPVRRMHPWMCCLLLLGSLWFAAMASAQQSNNTELVAVPVPGTVMIDGSLDDWDLSGAIYTCYDVATLKDRASVWTAAMYDDKGLYLGLRWNDLSPMYNMIDPNVPGEEDTGWKGDCLQLRIQSDVQAHVTAWYCTPTGKPALHIHTGDIRQPSTRDLTRALEHGGKLGFKKNADGKGYVQELFLPWNIITGTGKAYTAGDAITFGMQFMWGADSGRDYPAHNYSDVVSSPTADRICFWYNEASWGKLVFSPTGHLTLPTPPWVKAALPKKIETFGPFELRYTLLNTALVSLVIEDAQGNRVRNLIGGVQRPAGANVDRWDGFDDNGTPVPPGVYHWRGLYHQPIIPRYMLNAMPHTNPPWKNATGTGGWGADHGAITDVAADSDRLYLLFQGAEGGAACIALDRNGNKLWGQGGAFQGGGTRLASNGTLVFYANATNTVSAIDAKTGRSARFATEATELDPGFGKDVAISGLAANAEKIIVSSATQNLIRVFDAKTLRPVATYTIPQPTGLAVAKDGTLYAVSNGRVVTVTADGQTNTVATPQLGKALDIDVAADGTLQVLDAARVQVLGYRDGKLVRETGIKGGRERLGRWNAQGILDPVGVAVDNTGDVWVAEGDPLTKRLAHYGATGKCVDEFVGPGPYGGDGIVDHFDKSRLYADTFELRVDWKTGKSRPYAVWARDSADFPPGNNNGFFDRHGKTLAYRGHRYFVLARGLIFIDRHGQWIPCAAIGSASSVGSNDFWSDLNDDGRIQPNEITPSPVKLDMRCGGWGWASAIGDDLVAFRLETGTGGIYAVRPALFSKSGVPIYTAQSLHKLNGKANSIAAAGDFLVMAASNPLTGYDRDGQVRWTYPQRFYGVHNSFGAPLPKEPGQVIGSIYVMGHANLGSHIGTVFMTNGYYGQRHLFTTDGLFVATLFPDGRMMPETPAKAVMGLDMSNVSPGGESFGGSLDRNVDGNVYLTGSFCGGPMIVVTRLDGLDTISRLPGGNFTVTQEALTTSATERAARLAAEAAEHGTQQPLTIAKLTPKVDGDLSEWHFDTNAVSWSADETRKASGALAYDAQNLYIAFRVTDRTPWVNNGQDAKTQYITGDSVDVQLALDPHANAKRTTPANGDLRLSIAPQNGGKISVMLYQPVVAGFAGAKIPFISPTGREDFDLVTSINDAVAQVTKQPTGYDIEIAVPLAKLGFTPTPGLKLRGDLGALFGDDLGTNCLLRMYWANKDTNITDDLPTETRLHPDQWGDVIVQ